MALRDDYRMVTAMRTDVSANGRSWSITHTNTKSCTPAMTKIMVDERMIDFPGLEYEGGGRIN